MMTEGQFLRRLVDYLIIAATTLFLSAPCLAEQPNVLLIYVDDLGYGDLGGYGHAVIQTPNIDALSPATTPRRVCVRRHAPVY